MIHIDTLKEEDIGTEVIYVSRVGHRETGYITSWNHINIFVNYGKTDGYGTATYPRDLYWDMTFTRFDILDIDFTEK